MRRDRHGEAHFVAEAPESKGEKERRVQWIILIGSPKNASRILLKRAEVNSPYGGFKFVSSEVLTVATEDCLLEFDAV
jgi:hypothetical protein